MPRPTHKAPRPRLPEHLYELEVLPGLEAYARAELAEVRGVKLEAEGLRFRFVGEPGRLARLRTAVAAYRVAHFAVPRPRGLLGHQLLGQLSAFLAEVAREGGHRSFRFSAAGKDSEVYARLAEALSASLGLPYQPEDGELLIRLHPEAGEAGGWAVLARLTPRPLSARAWRVCNRAGGLNASIAAALHRAAGPREADRVFNPMCGSGTLLIERAFMGPASALVGVDLDPEAVACAQQNAQASKRAMEVAQADALDTGLPPRSFDLIVADLPWGDAIGSHAGNAQLYPAFLREMHRVLSRQGRLAVLTHEIKLFEELMREQDRWRVRELFRVYSGGHWPRAYLLGKK